MIKKPFVVRKLIYADNIEEAIIKERKTKPSSIFVDPDWEEQHKDDTVV